MKVHVEAKPLHEPLAGGTPGATVSVEPLIAGSIALPRSWMESPGGRFLTPRLLWAMLSGKEVTTIPCPAFLIRHPSAGAVLVDTGLHPSVATDGLENFGRLNPAAGANACHAALARFMFRADAALQVAGSLSGGQMFRAGLACVLGGTKPPSLLILDEPTNHLDIESIEAVEAGLRAYDGALLVVSHDEAFLQAIGTTRRLDLAASTTRANGGIM